MMATHGEIRFLITVVSLATACVLSLAHPSPAQQPASTAEPSTTIATTNVAPAPLRLTNEEHPALTHARSLLADVEDGEFAFDDDAFYAFCRYVKSQVGQPCDTPLTTETETSQSPIPWRFLLERPRDYRGQLVTVEGSLLAKTGFQVAGPAGEELGTLHQCELGNPDTHGICTVVIIEPPGQIAIRSRVRVQGYFIKVRTFETTAEEIGSGPLLVARKLEPEMSSSSTNRPFSKKDRWPGIWLVGGTGILAFMWFILRRRVRRPTRDRDTPPASRCPHSSGPQSSAADDFAWMSDSTDHDETPKE